MVIKAKVNVRIPYDEEILGEWSRVCGKLRLRPFRMKITPHGEGGDFLMCEDEVYPENRNNGLVVYSGNKIREAMDEAGFPSATIRIEVWSNGALERSSLEYRVETLLPAKEQRIMAACRRFKVLVERRTFLTASSPHACHLVAKSPDSKVRITNKQARIRLLLAYGMLNKGEPIPRGAIQLIRSFSDDESSG